jgi:BASS family bile acid:Na+ symporter
MMAVLLFPVLAILVSVVALIQPALFTPLKSGIIPGLMLIMLMMGLQLSWEDFKQVRRLKRVVVLAITLQFLLMPLLAYLLAQGFDLSLELLIGMMLVGATAGGTASNVITYLARGHLALSVSLTLVSTLLSIVLMPLILQIYLGQSIDIPVSSMLLSLLQIVLLPIVLGMLLRHWLYDLISNIGSILSTLAIAIIVLVIATVVALNHDRFESLSASLMFAVILHNLLALLISYALIRWLHYNSVIARTVAIEVAMQNSGLSVALAIKYFGAISALPGALFSVWHNVSGAIFAAYWQSKNRRDNESS